MVAVMAELAEANQALVEMAKQIVAKEAELQSLLQSRPQPPAEKKLSAWIDGIGVSVDEPGTLFKARGLGESAAAALATTLQDIMAELRQAEQASRGPPVAAPATPVAVHITPGVAPAAASAPAAAEGGGMPRPSAEGPEPAVGPVVNPLLLAGRRTSASYASSCRQRGSGLLKTKPCFVKRASNRETS